MDNVGSMGKFMGVMLVVMIFSMVIVGIWDSVPIIKNSVHSVLDPSAGALLNWNLTLGMLLIVFILTIFMTLIQKYATDQEALKELRKEQKILQEEMKKYQHHPEKVMELQKQQFAFIPRTFQYTSRSILFTALPFILLFRWFYDTFTLLGDPKFLGFMSWFWFYLVSAMIFSGILRKLMKVV